MQALIKQRFLQCRQQNGEKERERAKISQPSSPSPITSSSSSFLHLNPIRVLMRRSIAHTPLLDSPPQSNMDSIKFQLRPNNPSPLRSISRISLLNWKQLRGNLFIFVSISVILAVFCYLLLFSQNSHKKKYWIVIDGGSTGTRIHVFEYLVSNGGSSSFNFGKEELGSMKVNPGLSSFERNPGSAGNSLLELLEFGKKKVPMDYWGETEIRLMATAGLRRLDVGVIERVLESCRSVLRSSGFKFQDDWASVITGSDEGIYAWVAANYALGTLGGDPRQTTGIVELGGASAQVTFVPSEPFPSEFAHKLKFGKLTYNLYSHSLLNFGQNIAYESLRELLISKDLKLSAESLRDEIFVDPCTPSGYLYSMESENFSPGTLDEKNKYLTNLHARGNFSECRSAALMVLQKGKDKCSYHSCSIGSTFIPKLQGKFLATENFFYTSKFFGLAPTTFLSNMELAGQQFCHEDWSKLQKKYHTFNKEDLLHYCFSSAYIVALLHDSLGIALNDERIEFANQVGNIPLDWALGAFILQNMADSNHPDWISTIITEDSSTFFSIFVISTILIFTAWLVTRWRNPQLKTIYDLEKGRYIVTRVSRS